MMNDPYAKSRSDFDYSTHDVNHGPYHDVEASEPDTVDRLLNRIANTLASCHAAMDRIEPLPASPLNRIKMAESLPIIQDLESIAGGLATLEDRINTAASKLGRPL